MLPDTPPVADSVELSVVMPVFNEEGTVVEAVKRALDVGMPAANLEILVVDNGSRDRSLERLRAQAWPPQVTILVLEHNRGKGGAVRYGARYARGEYLAVLDADLEYDPRDLLSMLASLKEEDAEAVIGSRLWRVNSAYGYWYVVGNKAINTVCNALYNTYLSDINACLKIVPTALFNSLGLRENGFGFDSEVVARLLRRGVRIHEVPIRYKARAREEGKKIKVLDGLQILRVLARCRVAAAGG